MKKICIMGLGYIGLPTAVVLALNGQEVTGVDTDMKLLERLRAGTFYIKEPHLARILNQVSKEEKLSFSSVPVAADVFIIAVPTPNKDDKSCDLSIIMDVLNNILPFLVPGNIVRQSYIYS